MSKQRYLEADYCHTGCRVRRATRGVFGDPHARIITLDRLQKKHIVVPVNDWRLAFMIARKKEFETFLVGRHGFTWKWKFDASIASGVIQ